MPTTAVSPARPLNSAHLTVAERVAIGEAARSAVPPAAHAQFAPAPGRADPVGVLIRQATSRVPELVPIRYGRMLVSPFTYYRGAAAVMAMDLATTPASGITAQLCGDAHLLNFGLFGSPERKLLFDVNDFDETYPGPWEWDVKRLAASLEVAARDNGFTEKQRRKIQIRMVRRYQKAMIQFAGMRELDVWYARSDVDEIRQVFDPQLKKTQEVAVDKALAKARTRDSLRAFGKLTAVVDGQRRIVAQPPLIVPIRDLLPDLERHELEATIRNLISNYRRTVQADRRALLSSFEFVDLARKVVGVGSVGTRCWIVLLHGRDGDDPLFLQVKEAQASVLAAHLGNRVHYAHQGERVVVGQRLMQSASDIFLGWHSAVAVDGRRRDFYVRQFADWKGSAAVENFLPPGMRGYGELCGWTLARAHARSGDRIAIAAYLGRDSEFAEAIADFSAAYADQNERDFGALQEARRSGRITAETP
ncbi:MAG TPA: DUF2252 domain-containing protein [Actinocrinis sp.]|nr:DUF2252 domain-containing protein [Actinocrinis sp.]